MNYGVISPEILLMCCAAPINDHGTIFHISQRFLIRTQQCDRAYSKCDRQFQQFFFLLENVVTDFVGLIKKKVKTKPIYSLSSFKCYLK